MTLTLADDPALENLTEQDLKLDLACALFARGKIGKVHAAELAGVGLIAFQRALADRHIETCDIDDLNRDVQTLSMT